MRRSIRNGARAAARTAECAALFVALFAGGGRAEEAKPVRVGASHRVDVIAPGERVETAIDRMRRNSLPTRDLPPRPLQRLAPRPPSERAAETRAGSERGTAERGSDRGAAERGSERPEQPKAGAPPTVTPGPVRR